MTTIALPVLCTGELKKMYQNNKLKKTITYAVIPLIKSYNFIVKKTLSKGREVIMIK